MSNSTATDVIAALERAPGIVLPLVQEVPPAVLKRRPAPKKWSAHEHACHLDLADALRRYVDDRAQLVARLRALPAGDWNRTAEHAEYNRYSVLIMFRHLALHDFFHAYRIEELLLKKDWERTS